MTDLATIKAEALEAAQPFIKPYRHALYNLAHLENRLARHHSAAVKWEIGRLTERHQRRQLGTFERWDHGDGLAERLIEPSPKELNDMNQRHIESVNRLEQAKPGDINTSSQWTPKEVAEYNQLSNAVYQAKEQLIPISFQ